MENLQLSDMDSLVLKARNQNSKGYILEAVNAYRVGSLRSAIVSTWISLTFDIISKIRELSASEDSEAIRIISKLDNAIKNNDNKAFLNIEADILEDAKRLELISHHEFYTLKKLQSDRHLCAHPAYNLNDELFQPSPELVRTHIVHALIYVLTQKPIQGKKAIQNLLDDINGANFPTNYDEVNNFIKSKYLDRAKESFIENSIKVILKNIIKDSNIDEINIKFSLVLGCFMNNKRQDTMKVIKNNINKYIDTHETNSLLNVLKLLPFDPDIWLILSHENKISINTALKNNFEKIIYNNHIYKNLNNLEIKNLILELIGELPKTKKRYLFQEVVCIEFTDLAVDAFCNSSTYVETKSNANSFLFDYAHFFKIIHIKKILEHVHSNSSIRNYLNLESILKRIFIKTNHLIEFVRPNWEALLALDTTKYSFIAQLLDPTSHTEETEDI